MVGLVGGGAGGVTKNPEVCSIWPGDIFVMGIMHGYLGYRTLAFYGYSRDQDHNSFHQMAYREEYGLESGHYLNYLGTRKQNTTQILEHIYRNLRTKELQTPDLHIRKRVMNEETGIETRWSWQNVPTWPWSWHFCFPQDEENDIHYSARWGTWGDYGDSQNFLHTDSGKPGNQHLLHHYQAKNGV